MDTTSLHTQTIKDLLNRSLSEKFHKTDRSKIEIQNFGKEDTKLPIFYNFYTTKLGEILIASTDKGICQISFFDKEESAIHELKQNFPKSKLLQDEHSFHQSALPYFNTKTPPHSLKFHLKGTPFQLKVWKKLLEIPYGQIVSYRDIAESIGKSSASRAVGSAIGKNNLAYIIPCHRVVNISGQLSNYRWGGLRKSDLIKGEIFKTISNRT